MSSDNYDNISKTVKDVTKVVSEKSMADAAKEVKGESGVIIKSVLATGYLGRTKQLTNSKIDIIRNFWDCLNTEHNLESMTNAIIASLYHVSDYHESSRKQTILGVNFKKIKLMAPIIQK